MSLTGVNIVNKKITWRGDIMKESKVHLLSKNYRTTM